MPRELRGILIASASRAGRVLKKICRAPELRPVCVRRTYEVEKNEGGEQGLSCETLL